MSFDIIAEPTVRSPDDAKPRRGRGFSRHEVQKAGLSIKEARDMGLIIDKRRRSTYDENVEALKQYMKDLKEVAKKVKAPKVKTDKKDDAVSVLSSIRAVKKADATKLVDAGIFTLEDLAYCEIPKVAKKSGIDEDALTVMVKAALKKV